MKKEEYFLDRRCKLTLKNGFILYGIPIEVSESGVLFQTDQKTSFQAWSNVSELILEG